VNVAGKIFLSYFMFLLRHELGSPAGSQWSGIGGLWHVHHAVNTDNIAIPVYLASARGQAFLGTYQTGEH